MPQGNPFDGLPFTFADRFLQDQAGQFISEPRTAILELITDSVSPVATMPQTESES